MTLDELKVFQDGFRCGAKKGAERAVQVVRFERLEESKKENPDYRRATERAVIRIGKEFGIQ